MKLVAVSVVKNEADVIEAFVRHTQAWVDLHLVFDHDSTDGTRTILAQLVAEGTRLALFTGDAVGNLQQSRSNHLARLAFATHAADWVLPLDADEFLVAPDRPALVAALASGPGDEPVHLFLRNYTPSTADDPVENNPVLRLRHRKRGAGTTAKVFVPRALGLRDDTAAGKGNHALYRDGRPLPTRPLPDAWLAHFALRTPYQQVVRVLTAELQKLSRGRAHEGLDLHYRLGFQLLAEDPARFFSTVLQPPARLQLDPAPYLGGPLRFTPGGGDLARSARALVPFLEKLALSHGRLADQVNATAEPAAETIRPLEPATMPPPPAAGAPSFSGFEPREGWQPAEGPVPEAFLPPFHWATAPETCLTIASPTARTVHLEAEALSYAERQATTVLLNGVEVLHATFPRVNQKEILRAPLTLRAGENRLVFRHATWLESAADPRKLALIFLSLRIG